VTVPASDTDATIPIAPRVMLSDRPPGARIDHFEIDRRLGAGGMGTVYLARDLSLDRPVAIKVLPDEVASTEAQERFIREAQAQPRLSSPHVVQIYFIGHAAVASGKVLYFAMELVPGGSLDAVLERGEHLEPEEARRFMIQVSRGLRDAHRAGIVHRDIKPG